MQNFWYILQLMFWVDKKIFITLDFKYILQLIFEIDKKVFVFSNT